ncbi:MAG TPA: error-prone DNA polymerase [Lacunisphaera sp.]|jgi:error-prone DNA polymerase
MNGYVELHARSAFSFLRGASNPEIMAEVACKLNLPALALLDRDGVYGAPRLYGPARENGLRALVGAEITMEDGSVVPLLAASRVGYQNLCQLITESKFTERPPLLSAPDFDSALDPTERKRPCFATWSELAAYSEGLIALTGDEEGPVRRAWQMAGKDAARVALQKLTAVFGQDRLYVELQRHRLRGENREIQFLTDLAAAHHLPLLATGGVNYASKSGREIADVFTCLRLHTTLDGAGRALSRNDGRHLKSATEMTELFADLPEAVANTLRLSDRFDFTLENLGYKFPTFSTINGEYEHLKQVTFAAAHHKYKYFSNKLRRQLHRELRLIAQLGFCGYFLIVWDICRWAHEKKILIQGRGSAANSAVCYVLGITAVDPTKHNLLFERFLSKGRTGSDGNPSWPDIDLDLPSGDRREEVIQEIYRRYGQRGAAMTANVITYRGRSVVREVGKVLGFVEDALDRFSSLYANGDFPQTLDLQKQLEMSGIASAHPRAAALHRLYHGIRSLPRHLGQHSGGMVICQDQLDRVVPLENASMPGRTVCQWDKEDCENLGIVKIDFLGLGMMAVMQDAFELCAQRGGPGHFRNIPQNDVLTYEAIRTADTIGVFQIESRAQMSTLPRFKPKDLYDLAMEVALVRPGPITGNLVHPLIRRRDGLEEPDYIHPSVEAVVKPILERTKGVILFQEQMIELSMKLAHFNGSEAEQLRRAMGFVKDQGVKLGQALEKLTAALVTAGHNQTVIERVTYSAKTFAAYGFPESHAISFALLAYASTYLKVHWPAEFYASLLNNQPMGFYSAATLLQDSRRFSQLKTQPACVQSSMWDCTVEGEKVIRLGLRYVRGVRETSVKAMLDTRKEKAFASIEDFFQRTCFSVIERRALATIGALNEFGLHRRSALWQVEAAWSGEESLFHQFAGAENDDCPLAPMNLAERFQADFSTMGLTTGRHPMIALRARLPGVCTAAELKERRDGEHVTIAGTVICRQRPGTAKGVVFVSLEDETGIANAVVYAPLFEKFRLTITQESALKIYGKLQKVSNVIHVKAEKIAPLREADLPVQASHDFH